MLLVKLFSNFLEDNNDGSVGTHNKNKLEVRIKALERGTSGATIKLNNPAKKIEKYSNGTNGNGNYNTGAEMQLSKKKTERAVEESDEEVEVKKPKKKQKVVVEESD